MCMNFLSVGFRCLTSWCRALFFIACALIAVPAIATAGEPAPNFEVECTTSARCPDIGARQRIESMVRDAWQRLASLGFPSPLTRMKRRIDSSGPPTVAIQFCDPQAASSSANCRSNSSDFLAYAYTSECTADESWPPDTTTIVIGQAVVSAPEPIAYYLLAHEVFHLFSMRAGAAGRYLCADSVPQWVTEGAAVFSGFWATEQRFGTGALRPAFDSLTARSYYGIRPYQLPITLDHGDYRYENQTASTSLAYYTSSIWRYLAERFHDGSPAYLARYLATPPVRCAPGSTSHATCRSDAAWLTWLDAQMKSDPRIRRPLQETLPEFLTEYATWAPRRFSDLNEQHWRETAFDGCRSVELSPKSLEVSIDIDARMYAATCVQVTVDGIPAGNLVTLQISAEDGKDPRSPIWVDGTRVGVADYGAPLVDQIRPENCFEVRAIAGSGEDTCLIDGHPRTETAPSAGGARRVNVFRTHPQKATGSAFVDTLVITQTYRAPGSDASNEAARPMRLHIGLLTDHAAMADTAAGVDAPVRIELDLVNVAQATADRTPRALENAGDNACTFVLHAKKRSTKEMVTLHLTNRGPITLGRYDIVDEGVGQKVPGRAVTHFAVRAGPSDQMVEFRGIGGHLELSQITRAGVVSGIARIMGKRTTSRKRFGGPDALAIEAVFTAVVRDPLRSIEAVGKPAADRDAAGSDCLVAESTR